ncbi:hypothetical protein M514_15198 [Trichuris suis]|uniref:Uncharacterized protein n=1 Tax=Trichuris suis TaxID=68888 RepID=A0A085NTJ8_9BILA|nr:hypothetical protein M514_15198 [Trichuris suis]
MQKNRTRTSSDPKVDSKEDLGCIVKPCLCSSTKMDKEEKIWLKRRLQREDARVVRNSTFDERGGQRRRSNVRTTKSGSLPVDSRRE